MASASAISGVQNTPVAVKYEPEDQVTTALDIKQEVVSNILPRDIEDTDQQIPTVSAENFALATTGRARDDATPSKMSKITFNLDGLIVVKMTDN